MLVLILTVCSLAQPDRCDEARLPFADDISPLTCMTQAPPYLAQWAEAHPGQRVARWRCAYLEREGSRI